MAVEPRQSSGTHEEGSPENVAGPLTMLQGEEPLTETSGAGGARFILTNLRVLYTGGSEDAVEFESARLTDVAAVRMERRSRDRRSAIWSVIGLLTAIGVWQVTRNESVGAIVAAIVGFVSIALLADYWLRRPGMMMTFLTPGGPIGGQIQDSDAQAAEEFIGRLERQRAEVSRRPADRPVSRIYARMRHPLL